MKKIGTYFLLLLMLVLNTALHATSTPLFSIKASGVPASITLVLCLNGKGALSCQQYHALAQSLEITTTVKRHYPLVGIKIITPSYTPSGCTPNENGYCLFDIPAQGSTSINVTSSTSYTVSVAGDGHETISPDSVQHVAAQQTQTFSVTALNGYSLNTAVGGTCPAGVWSGAHYTTGAITQSCTVLFSAINTSSLVLDGGPLLLPPNTSSSLTITNNGNFSAFNVQATLPPGLAAHVLQDASACVALPPATSCRLLFTADNSTYAQTPITITGTNSNTLSTTIALDYMYVTNGSVSASAFDSTTNTLYIAGNFTQVGPNTGSGVPIDSASGLPLSTYARVNGTVFTTVTDTVGGWYIGGDFTYVDGVARNNIAHLLPDGSLDSYWNPNANGIVRALVLNGAIIYAGGTFTSIGGQARTNIAALDSTTGLATIWAPNADNDVYTLAVSGDTVYAGGYFTNIGGQIRNYIAALDSGTGSATLWSPNADGPVSTLAVNGATVYAGGYFTIIGGQTRNYIAALDSGTGSATAWAPNANGPASTLALTASTVYLGGLFFTLNNLPSPYLGLYPTL